MTTKEYVSFDYALYKANSELSDVEAAIHNIALSNAKQFEAIKKEKWYHRLFDCVTFSQKGKKRMSEQISSLSQAQQVLTEILLRLSAQDAQVALLLNQNIQAIRKLSENDLYLQERLSQLEATVLLGIRKIDDIKQLSDNEKRVLTACLNKLCSLMEYPSEEQQEYANNVIIYLDENAEEDKPLGKALSNIQESSRRIMLNCCFEYLFLNKLNFECSDQIANFLDEFDLGNKTIKQLKHRVMSTFDLRGENGLINKYNIHNNNEFTQDFCFEYENVEIETEHNTTDIEKDADNSSTDRLENNYNGIPLEIAQKIYKNSLCYYGKQLSEISFFETKDYFVWNYDKEYDLKNHTSTYKWKRFNKNSHAEDEITMYNVTDETFRRRADYCCISKSCFAVDYNQNTVYYISNSNHYDEKQRLCKYNVDSNTYIVYDIEIQNRIISIEQNNNTVLLISHDDIVCFDTIHKESNVLTDAAEKNIVSYKAKCTVNNEKIFFVPDDANKLSADDGGSLVDCLCMYDFRFKKTFRLLELDASNIKSIFSIHSKMYLLMYRESSYNGFVIKELCNKSNDEYTLEPVFENEKDCYFTLYDNFLTYYEYDTTFSIYTFDFISQSSKKVASDCMLYDNIGVFKANWQRKKSSYIMLGQWIYYVKGSIPYKSSDPCIASIYRTNIDVPLRPVNLGKYNDLAN